MLLALEYFAQVYRGGIDATANVKGFVAEFLKEANERYVQVGDLIWRAFRNGLVHGGWPKVLCIAGKPSETIELMVGVMPGDPHLAPYTGRPDTFCLNAIQLLRDLEAVVHGKFGQWVLETQEDVLNRGAPRRLDVSAGDDEAVAQFSKVRKWNGHIESAG